MKLIVFGLSITSSWGNGHATTYRGLLREFAARGHEVFFLERNQPWYSSHRDLTDPPHRVEIYETLFEMQERFAGEVAEADAVVVGSYVPEAIALGEWALTVATGLVAFYDIDTPITLEALESESCAYLTPELVGTYDLYLSFSGGPILQRLRETFRAPAVAPLYCSADPGLESTNVIHKRWDLGYLGTYSRDRQPVLEEFLITPARAEKERSFVVAGPQYPAGIHWPQNVTRIEHLAPDSHAAFYLQQRFTLNVTRAAMVAAGYSPSVRLFEAAACGVPVITDSWNGLEEFFEPGREILVAETAEDVRDILRRYSPDESAEIGRHARERVLREHTAAHRAAELEHLLQTTPAARSREVVV